MKKRALAFFLALSMIVLSAPMTALAAEVQLTGNDTDGYSVNLPATGTDTLDLSGKSAGFTFKVYDDGGPDANYSNNCDGYLQITAPNGCILKISGSGSTENNYDYLYIYDGASTVPLGQAGWCGSFTVNEMYSSSVSLTVRLTSDYSNNDSGFALDVTVVDQDSMAAITYSYAGSTQRIMRAKGTEITLPEFSSLFTAPEGSTFRGWRYGETLYGENVPFTLNEDVTFTAVVDEPPVVFGDDDAGWYANMPVTGTATADLSDRQSGFTLHVYDNGGSGSNYYNNCDGYMRLIAPSNCVLRVSGGGNTENNYDFLRLYDGDSQNALGSDKYQGSSITVDTMMTSGNVLRIYFYSDGSQTYYGFDLTVTVVDLASLATLSFNAGEGSGTMNGITVIPGEEVVIPYSEFTAPENTLFAYYTDAGGDQYFPGTTLTLNENLLLTAVYAASVTVTYVNGEESTLAYYAEGTQIALPTFDSLFTLPERKHFSGWQCGETTFDAGVLFTVTGDVAFTALVEDDPVVLHGESGTAYANYENYAILPKNTSVTADLTGVSEGYTLWVFDNGGTGYYTSGCDGSLTVLAPEGCIMQITSDLNTESGCDFLYVYDGDSTAADQLGKFSGSSGTGKLYCTGSAVTVRFTSDGRYNYRGIDMKIIVIDPRSLVTVSFDPGEGGGTMDDIVLLPGDQVYLPHCGFELPEKTYFDYYTDGTKHYKPSDYITVTEDLHLTAVYIEKIIITYKGHNDQTATANYRKGAQFYLATYETRFSRLPYGKELKQWRNETNGEAYAPQTLVTANADVTYTAEFESIPYLIDDGEGGYYALMPVSENIDDFILSDKQNGFTFKLYDNGGQNVYANNCNGSLTLTAPEGYVFRFSGEGLTEQDADILSIYDSDGTTLLGGSAYSSSFTLTDLQTSSNTMRVQFISDSSYTRAGFMLNVTVVDPSTLITVSFDAGEGSGAMDAITVLSGTEITLPDYGFTAPESKIFSGYSDGTHTYWPGNTVAFTANTTLTAQWAAATGFTYTCKGDSHAVRYPLGSTVTLPELTDLFTMPAGMHFTGWKEKFSGSVYQAGDEFVANDPTEFTAQLEILYSDGEGGYFVLMPLWNVNDPLLLDLSDRPSGFTFILYDDGGKDGNHSNDNNAEIVIKAPENMVVTVSGRVVLERYYDYLKFYNGVNDRSPQLGESKYYGNNVAIGPLTTDGEYLTVYFHSDDEADNAGFELTVTVFAQVAVTYEFDGETKVVAVQKDSTIALAGFGDLFDSETKEFVCWQLGDDTYAEGDEFVVTGDVTFTAVTRLMPTVTLDGNGATVIGYDLTSYGPIAFPTGTTDRLPHANMIFNIPENKCFGGWSYNGRTYAVGEEFTITENVTFEAVWRDLNAWDQLGVTLGAATGDLGTITLTEDAVAAVGSLTLTVPAGVTVTIDLNGHTLDGTNAAVMDGGMLTVNGSLTFTGSGAVTGGGIMVLSSATLNAPTLGYGAALKMVYTYEDEDTDTRYPNQLYATVYCPTLYQAFQMAALPKDYKDKITTLPANNYFWYEDYRVVMLADAIIPTGETWTVNSEDSIWFDLNGHTFDVQGAFVGGYNGWQYSNGQYSEVFYPTNVQIVSETTTGVFRSSGSIGVSIQPWTADTYYFTGGSISGFVGADGGTFHISGGHFTGIVMFNNGNEDADLEIEISGDAEFDRLEHMIYTGDDASGIHMTISGGTRIKAMLFEIMGEGVLTYPVLTVNGGYFGVDPRTWLAAAGGNENVVQITAEPEEYGSQTDWTADSDTYTWRITDASSGGQFIPGDINGDGEVDSSDLTALARHAAKIDEIKDAALLQAADVNRDGTIDASDLTHLARYVARIINEL